MTRREQARGRGFFGIGIEHPKTVDNLGTLWRGALNFDAAFYFTIAHRYHRQCSDTVASFRHIPYTHYADVEDWQTHIPRDCVPVAVELVEGSKPLETYTHPPRAVYLLGPEDGSVSAAALAVCRDVVSIDSRYCLNVAQAGSIVMYDRALKARLSGSVVQSGQARHPVKVETAGSNPVGAAEPSVP